MDLLIKVFETRQEADDFADDNGGTVVEANRIKLRPLEKDGTSVNRPLDNDGMDRFIVVATLAN
jgi:nitrous oxide reductase accessory protein NosL